jgi:ribosomal protein S18 acetylase RimI-like enzyme
MSSSSSTSPCQFRIREATANDIDGILQCLASAFEPYQREYTVAGYQDTVLNRETLSQRLRQMMILVAVDSNDKIVGTIACQAVGGGEGHLRGMAVLPECQGQGIADELIKRAEHILAQRRCIRVTLDTTDPLRRAMRFYERNGFIRTGKISDFFGMPLIEYAKGLNRNS